MAKQRPTPKAPAHLKKAIRDAAGRAPDGLPHLSELAENFIRIRGGPSKVAEMLSEEWNQAPPGGVVRTRILDLISRVWKVGSDAGVKADDMGVLSNEDLAREAALMLESLGDDGDGSAEEAAEPEQHPGPGGPAQEPPLGAAAGSGW